MAVSGRVSSIGIASSILNTTKSQKEAAQQLSIHQTLGVRPKAAVSATGSGRGAGTKISGGARLKGGRF